MQKGSAIKSESVSSVLGLEAFKSVDLEVLHEAVELLLGLLVLVLLSADSHAHLAGNVPDASAPHEAVQAGVYTHVLNTRDIRYTHQQKEWGKVPW